jgi:autotransporter-associated beta strand protein
LDANGNEVFELLWYQGSTSAIAQILARSATQTQTTLPAGNQQPQIQGTVVDNNINAGGVNSASASTAPSALVPVNITLANNQVTYVVDNGTPATFALNSNATNITKLEFCEVWNQTLVDTQNKGFWLDNVSVVSGASGVLDSWTGANNNSWTTAANWNPAAVPSTGDYVSFDSASTANLSTVLNGDFNIAALSLTTPSGPVAIGGANTLTLGSGGVGMATATQNLTITAPLVLGASQTWNVASNQTVAVNGGVSGSGAGLSLLGGGTVSLGSAATYTGDTTITAGTVRIGTANALPSGAGNGKVSMGAGVSLLDLNGHDLTINGLVSSYNAPAVVDNLAGGAVTLTVGDDNSYGTFDGNIQNTTGTLSLVKAGAGTVFLRGANSTYSGPTTILNGILKFGTSGAAGDSGVNRLPATTVLTLGDAVNNTGGELMLNSRSQTLAGLSTAGFGYNVIVNEGGGACTLTVSNTTDYTFNGVMGGVAVNDNNFSLAKAGSGTLTLVAGYGNNTYTGNTIVNGGTLALSGSGSIIPSSANIIVAGGAVLDVSGDSGFTVSSQTLTNSSTGAVINGGCDVSSGTLSLVYDGTNASFIITNGALNLASSTVVTVNNSGPMLLPGHYTVIAAAATGNPGSVTGTLPTSAVVTGNGSVNGASLQFNANGGLDLVVSSAAWSGAVDNSWTTPGNWTVGFSPNPGDPVFFSSDSVANLSTVLNADFFISQLSLTAPAGPVSIGGANNLYLGSGGINMGVASQDLTITAPMNIGGNQQTWTVTNSRTLSVSGGITGAGGAVAIGGGGKLLLGGTNTYTGGTTIGASATLQASAANVLPNGTGAGNVINNGMFDLNGFAQAINGLTNNGVVDNTAAGAVALTVGGTNVASTANGPIQNTGGALTLIKGGSGGSLVLNTTNGYTGGTIINSGAIYPKNNFALGTGPVWVNAGTLYCVSNNVLTNALTFTNTLTLNGGTLELGGGNGKTLNWTGPIAVTNNSNLHADGNTAGLTISGSLDLGSGSYTLTSRNDGGSTGTIIAGPITGSSGLINVVSGTLALKGTNTYGGTLRAAGGTLSLNNIYAAQDATIDYNAADSGGINYNGLNAIIGALTGSRNFALNPTLAVGNNNLSTNYDGAISGPGGITKIGTGTWTLTGTNSYTGDTTISAGTLALSGIGAISGSTNIIVAGGATLDVSAKSPMFALAGRTLANSSAWAVLNGSSDCSTGTLALVSDGVHPAFVQTNGTLTLSAGTVVTVNNTGAPLGNGSYPLIAAATAGNVGQVSGPLPAVVVTGNGTPGAAGLQINGAGGLDLVVSGATPSQPTISKVTVTGGNLILQGTNGAASGTYAILTSTNVALPLSSWTTNTTGTFTAGGAFSNAVPVTTEPKRFFLIKQP